MFIELVQSLRCLRDHEDSWLVATFVQSGARHVIEGWLGCPVCGTEYPVTHGVAHFGTPAAPGQPLPPVASSSAPAPDGDRALRLAAMLHLVGEGGVVLLEGEWGTLSPTLGALVHVQQLLVNPPAAEFRPGTSVIRVEGALPVSAGALRAAAVSEGAQVPIEAVVRALQPGGRLVAPHTTPLPEGVTEVARDDSVWVAERSASAPPRLVALGRAGGR